MSTTIYGGEMKDFMCIFGLIVVLVLVSAVSILGAGVAADYWNGTARAELIYRQTGERYTWREAAQIKTMYDRQNIRISFEQRERGER